MFTQSKRRLTAATLDLIHKTAFGRYSEILQSAGADPRTLTRPNRACPWCAGRDRFSYTDKFGKGDSFCRHCGYHSGIDYLMVLKGFGYREALCWIADYFGIPLEEAAPEKPSLKPKKLSAEERIEKIWKSARPIGPKDSAYAYLCARGLSAPFPSSLRASDALFYKESSEEGAEEAGSFHEGLVAEISDAAGRRVNLHRTYLKGARKALLKDAKKVMEGALAGCAVRLSESHKDGVLGLAEGIETALSAAALFKVPVWSVVAAFNFKHFTPPEGVRRLIIFADSDLNFVGQREAFAGAAALKQRFPELSVEVRLPAKEGCDWNDVLLAKKASVA